MSRSRTVDDVPDDRGLLRPERPLEREKESDRARRRRIFSATPNVCYLLGAGDLTQDGTDEQLARFRRELEAFDIPYYTTLGNHDVGDCYQEWFGRGSFS